MLTHQQRGSSHRERRLVVGAGKDPYRSYTTRPRLGMHPLNANVYETLLELDCDYAIRAGLAESWELLGDGVGFRFYLRPGVLFHDGQELKAEAVKFSFSRLVRKGIDFAAYLGRDSVTIVDDLTVDIRPVRPNLRLPEQLTQPTYSIVATGSEPESGDVIGTGRYQLEEYSADRCLRVSSASSVGVPSNIDFVFFLDSKRREAALSAGDADIIFDSNEGMRGSPEFARHVAPCGSTVIACLNVRGEQPFELLGDQTIRLALAMSTDRQAIVDEVYCGNGVPAKGVTPAAVLGSHAQVIAGQEWQPEAAEVLLTADGWRRSSDGTYSKGGRRLELVALTYVGDPLISVARLIQQQWKSLGIDLRLEFTSAGLFNERLRSGQFDMYVVSTNQNTADPVLLLALRWYRDSRVPWYGYQRLGGVFDDLVSEALECSEVDEARRLSALAQRELVDNEAGALPLVGLSATYSSRSDLEGFVPHPSRQSQQWSGVRFGSLDGAPA